MTASALTPSRVRQIGRCFPASVALGAADRDARAQAQLIEDMEARARCYGRACVAVARSGAA